MSLLIPDIGAAFGQTLLGSTGAVADPRRVPMFFTSTHRLRSLNEELGVDLRTDIVEASTLRARFRQQQHELGRLQQGIGIQPIIKMAVNPSTITWRQPKRIVKRDTRQGSVFFHFSNTRGQNNDILTMDFRGNTGNIDPRGSLETETNILTTNAGANTNAIRKQVVWHNLWNLTREAILLEDNTKNVFMIFYSSPIIPVQIQLRGFFSNVLEWTDAADKPFSKDYSFGFTVEETVPDIDDLVTLVQQTAFDPETATSGLT